MMFPEGLTGDVQVIQAAVKPVWRMDRTPPNKPLTITPVALHAPGRMRHSRGGGGVESQRFAVQYRGINDIARLATGNEHGAMVWGYAWGNQHGAHAATRLKAERYEQGVQSPIAGPARPPGPVGEPGVEEIHCVIAWQWAGIVVV